MRYLFGFLCVCALGLVPQVGCGETGGTDLCEGVVCDDGNECTLDSCIPADGTCDNGAVPDGTACSDGACLDAVCTALVTVSGTVTLDENGSGSPAEGATVSWLGTSLSTTTDASGRFSLELPIGNLFLRTSKAGTWGEIQLVWTAGASDLEFGVISDAELAQWWQDLGVDVDTTKGGVGVTFLEFSGLGGESAILSERYDSSWAEDANDTLVMSHELLPGRWPWLDFVNVDPTEELTVMPMGAEGVNTCSLQVPGTVYPVRAKFLTGVEVLCTPL
jgi:hypothetical protein